MFDEISKIFDREDDCKGFPSESDEAQLMKDNQGA